MSRTTSRILISALVLFQFGGSTVACGGGGENEEADDGSSAGGEASSASGKADDGTVPDGEDPSTDGSLPDGEGPSADGSLPDESDTTQGPGDPAAPPDSSPPQVSILKPADGDRLNAAVYVEVEAVDDSAVAGVQLLVDGVPIGEEDNEPPYLLPFDPLTSGAGAHTIKVIAKDTSGNSATSSAVSIEVEAELPDGHPKIWLDPLNLEELAQRAANGDPQWTALRAQCDAHLSGAVEYPDGDGYPDSGIGPGYHGDGYINPVIELGLCYQVGKASGAPMADGWGQRGAEVLDKISRPPGAAHYVDPGNGYGIRFYGTSMALGYDWLFDVLSPTQRSQLVASMNHWLDRYASNGIGPDHPQGNYFAGYYAAKAYAAIATEGENSAKPQLWTQWLDGMHRGLVAPYYEQWLKGGGWPEGWHYGGYSLNMELPILAARSAKGVDLLHDSSTPYSFPLGQSLHLIHFAWPNRKRIDDRGTIRQADSTLIKPSMVTVHAGLAQRWGDPNAPVFQAFARTIRDLSGPARAWEDFLFWNETAPEVDFTTLPRSYATQGMGEVAARSDWSTDAVWGSFRAGPYINSPASGEEYFDQGALAIVRGDSPLLINVSGTAVASYPPSSYSTEADVYANNWGSSSAPRDIYNIFYNGAGQTIAAPSDNPSPKTRLARYEDMGDYVQFRGEHLEDVSSNAAALVSWTRDVIFVRPSLFVVYDRTNVSTDNDQRLHWHFLSTPTLTPASSGGTRYDVVHPQRGFLGSMTSLLPAGHVTHRVDVFDSGKMFRVEVRPGSSGAQQQWLTVLDASASPAAVAGTSVINASSGASPNVQGANLNRAGEQTVVLFSTGAWDQAISGPVSYGVPVASTMHVIADLQPGVQYAVGVTTVGNEHRVNVQPGAGIMSSPNGTLEFHVTSGGQLQTN